MKRKTRRPAHRETAGPIADSSHPHPARIYRELKSNGSSWWTLFDSGSRRTYVSRAVARRIGIKRLAVPVWRGLGGRNHKITHCCVLVGTVERFGISAEAFVVDHRFPDERGRPIDVILGMESMESWGIGLDTAHKRLDFTHYAREAFEG